MINVLHVTLYQAFFFSAGKITQAQNNSSSKITQGFFKKKLNVSEEFALYVIAKNQTTVRKLQKISKLALKRFKKLHKFADFVAKPSHFHENINLFLEKLKVVK